MPNFGLWTRNYTVKAEASSYPKIALNNLSFYELGKIKILTAASIGYEVDPLFIFNDGKKFLHMNQILLKLLYLLVLQYLIMWLQV